MPQLAQVPAKPVLQEDMAWESVLQLSAAVLVQLATIVLPGHRALQRIPVSLAPTLLLGKLLPSVRPVLQEGSGRRNTSQMPTARVFAARDTTALSVQPQVLL